MIVSRPPKPGAPRVTELKPADVSTVDGKALILQRSINGCQFRGENERVKIRRGHKRGNVLEIIYDKDKVNWTGNKPHFVVVRFDDGDTMLCHPSQLKRSKI